MVSNELGNRPRSVLAKEANDHKGPSGTDGVASFGHKVADFGGIVIEEVILDVVQVSAGRVVFEPTMRVWKRLGIQDDGICGRIRPSNKRTSGGLRSGRLNGKRHESVLNCARRRSRHTGPHLPPRLWRRDLVDDIRTQ